MIIFYRLALCVLLDVLASSGPPRLKVKWKRSIIRVGSPRVGSPCSAADWITLVGGLFPTCALVLFTHLSGVQGDSWGFSLLCACREVMPCDDTVAVETKLIPEILLESRDLEQQHFPVCFCLWDVCAWETQKTRPNSHNSQTQRPFIPRDVCVTLRV